MASATDALPFDTSIHVRAFVLKRSAGNLLIYNASVLREKELRADGVERIERHYLNHCHEVQFFKPPLDVPLYCHADDAEAVAKETRVSDTFEARGMLDDDFEIIPIPGHTPGATAYLWNDGQDRFLFTGDSVSLSGGDWVAAVLESSDREKYVESLARLRDVEFDVLLPWAASKDEPFYARTNSRDSRQRFDAMIARIRDGQNH
ncbi:MBL fold metallo-hydrolase [Salinisphaera aquimarina]|uniref:MBL fold metallo-hydrolase n=1 Tax=Salinisphaera aquimarina TaxID=2094031 RepID=UPI0036D29CC1